MIAWMSGALTLQHQGTKSGYGFPLSLRVSVVPLIKKKSNKPQCLIAGYWREEVHWGAPLPWKARLWSSRKDVPRWTGLGGQLGSGGSPAILGVGELKLGDPHLTRQEETVEEGMSSLSLSLMN